MRRAAAAAALCAAAGCTALGVIKAYPGSDRGKDEIGIVATALREETFSVTDNRITTIDGVRYGKGDYEAHMLPGAHRIGVEGTLRVSRQVRVQHCIFDLNVEPGCTYRPTIPAYPRAQLDLPADSEWRVTRPVTVVAECSDATYAVQLPLDCSSNP